MAKQYSRREILRAMMLGGGLIAGELWWPGKTLISIPEEQGPLVYKATMRFSHGWVDERNVFGLAPIKPEGGVVMYDEGQSVEWSRVDDPKSYDVEGINELNEKNLEQIVVDVRRDMKDKLLSIKPRTIRV